MRWKERKPITHDNRHAQYTGQRAGTIHTRPRQGRQGRGKWRKVRAGTTKAMAGKGNDRTMTIKGQEQTHELNGKSHDMNGAEMHWKDRRKTREGQCMDGQGSKKQGARFVQGQEKTTTTKGNTVKPKG